MLTTYNVVSEDGFITDLDGSEEFIPDELWSKTLDFFSKFEIILMGRKTYEAMQKYDKDMLDKFERLKIRKGVITRNTDFKPKEGYEVFYSPEEALGSANNVLVTSGPELNTYLLRKNLIDEIVFWEIPEKIGSGVSPFSDKLGETWTDKIKRLKF